MATAPGGTGMMSSIRNMFSGAQATPDASAASQQTTARTAQSTPADTTQQIDPVTGQPVAPKKPQDPLAAFEKLWDNTPVEGAKKTPKFELTPEVISQAAESLDFSDSFPPDFMEKLVDQKDPKAFSEAMNKALRKLYSTSLSHHSILTDRFVDSRLSHDREGLGSQVTKTLAKNNLKSIAEKSPVAAKMMESVQNDLLSKNPDATPDWLQEQTEKFFMSIAGLLKPDEFVQGQKNAQQENTRDGLTQPKGQDWDTFFSGGTK